jgi:hypothetical protein
MLRELGGSRCALSVLGLDFGLGEVCALSALCAISLSSRNSVRIFPHGWPESGQVWDQVVKERPISENAWAHSCSSLKSTAHSAATSLYVGIESGKSYKAVVPHNEQLTIAEG